MGTKTAPKNGMARQHFGGDGHRVLKAGHGLMGSVPTAAQDACCNKKGEMWSLGKNKTTPC